MTKSTLYSIYFFFFFFDPEESTLSKPILTLCEKSFWNTNNTIKNFKSSVGGVFFCCSVFFLNMNRWSSMNQCNFLFFFPVHKWNTVNPFILIALWSASRAFKKRCASQYKILKKVNCKYELQPGVRELSKLLKTCAKHLFYWTGTLYFKFINIFSVSFKLWVCIE